MVADRRNQLGHSNYNTIQPGTAYYSVLGLLVFAFVCNTGTNNISVSGNYYPTIFGRNYDRMWALHRRLNRPSLATLRLGT